MADARPPAPGSVRPTVLVVGDDEPMDEAICASLEKNGLDVERVTTLEAVEATRIAAPDLVLLVGDAAHAAGESVLARLAQNPLTQIVPVVLLSDDAALGQRFAAFRHGAVAVVPRSASVDEMARKVADIAREMPERRGEQAGVLGESTFDELMKLVKQELRSGILSVEGAGGTTEGSTAFRLVLGAGKPVAKAVEAFVTQLRPHVSKAEPLRYELLEHAGARFGLLDADTGGATSGDADLSALRGLRVLLVVVDPVPSDALASELRASGATVAVTDVEGRGLDRARGLDPEVVIIDAAAMEGQGFAVVKACRRDPRLRWASMLIVEWSELWPEGAKSPDMQRLASRIAPLIEPDRTTTERARKETGFDTRLEQLGPSRLLRALARVEPTLHVTVRNPRCAVDVDLSQGLVVGAVAKRQGTGPGTQSLEGNAALAALLALGSGRVRVERRKNPQSANVMAPLEEALAMAASEEPPLAPSVPPPNPELDGPGGASSAQPPPSAPTMNPFEEAPTGTHSAPSAGVAKRTLVGLPGPRLRAVPTEQPAPLPKLGPRPRTMLGLAPAPGPQLPSAASATSSALSMASAATVPAGPLHQAAPDARFPLPARVPEEATGAAAASPAATVAPARRELPPAPAMLSTRPGPYGGAAPPATPVADVIFSEHAIEPAQPPLAYDSFVIPDASMIPSVAAPPAARRHAPRPSVAPWMAIAGVGAGLFAILVLSAIIIVPRLIDWLITPPPTALPAPQGPTAPTFVPPTADANPPSRPTAAQPASPLHGAAPIANAPALPVAPPPVAPPRVAPPVAPPPVAPAPVAPLPVAPPVAPPPVAPSSVAPPAGGEPSPADSGLDGAGEERDPDTDFSAGDRLVVRANRLVAEGDLRQGEAAYLRALALESRNPHALAGLARLHLARRSGRQALSYAEQAVAVRPRRASYRVLLGDALSSLNRRNEAQRAYREALRIDPRNRSARERLGRH